MRCTQSVITMRIQLAAVALLVTTSLSAQSLEDLDVSGYVQAQFVSDERSQDELTGSGSKNRDQFSIRRGRLTAAYQVTDAVRVVAQTDLSSSGVSLKDLYVELTEPWTGWKNTLRAGQFIWPFGFELQYSASAREMPEQSRVVRTLFPDERDRGVMLSGRAAGENLRYQLAVVNGTGVEYSGDLNQEKDVVGHVAYARGGVGLGASAYRGESLVATAANQAGVDFEKQRHGVDVQWTTPLPGFTVRAEYIAGKEPPAPNTIRSESHDVTGWYAYALQRLGKRHQLVARLDEYDPDTDIAGNAVRTLAAGYVFDFDKHSRVMLAYEMPRTEEGDIDDDVLTVRYQLKF